MPTEWYCRIGDREIGPLSSRQVADMASRGQLKPDDLVRGSPGSGWVHADQVKGLSFANSEEDLSAVEPAFVTRGSDQSSVTSPPPPPPPSPPASSQSRPHPHMESTPAKPTWLWVVAAAVAVCLFGCCGLLGIVLVFSDSGGYSSDGQVARLNIVGQDATNELQMLGAQMSNEEKVTLGLAVLLTGSDVYAARVQISNTGNVPVRVFPENIRIHYDQEAGEVTTFNHPAFLQAGVLQPGYSFEGLVVYEARLDIGAAIRLGAGGLSYDDPTVQVTYGP